MIRIIFRQEDNYRTKFMVILSSVTGFRVQD